MQTLVQVTVIKAHWGLGDGLDRGGVGKGASRLVQPGSWPAQVGGRGILCGQEHWQRVWAQGSAMYSLLDTLKWRALGDISGEMLRDSDSCGFTASKHRSVLRGTLMAVEARAVSK